MPGNDRIPSDIQMNINILKRYLDDNKIKPDIKEKIREVIDMYKNRSLKNFASASKMVKLLASKYKQSIDKGLRLYNEIARKLMKIRIILYRKGRDHEINNPVRRRKYMNKLLPDYKAFWTGYINVLARLEDMTRYVGNTIKKPAPNSSEADKLAWTNLIKIITTNQDIERYIYENDSGDGVGAVLILDYHVLPNISAISPVANRQRSIQKTNINFSYRINPLNLNAANLKEAIGNGLCQKFYRNNECWINALYAKYKDTLLSPDKKRYLITRDMIYQIINKTDVSVREGLNVHDLLPFFEKYKIQVRVFDVYRKLIFKYDPPSINYHNKPFYVLNDGDHIYLLDDNLHTLKEKMHTDDDTEGVTLPISHNYYINTKPNNIMYIMIDEVEDFFKKIKDLCIDYEDQSVIVNAIHRGDDLNHLLWQIIKEYEYMPSVEFNAGNITDIGLSFNNKKIMVFIKQQQLVKNEIDGLVKLDNEQTYNNLSNAFSDFKFKVLRNEHKSYYNQEDLEIYSECRTVANTGIMNIIHNIANTVEIDVSKAYSSAFCKITKIQIFTFFDKWQEYSGE